MSQFIDILIIFIGITGIGLAILYILRRHKVVSKAAARNIRNSFVAIAVVIIGWEILFLLLPDSWREPALTSISLLVSVGIWASIATWPRRRRQAGLVLLDISPYKRPKRVLVLVGLFVLIGIAILFKPESEIEIKDFSSSFLFLSFAIFALLSGLTHVEIREGGILFFFRFIKWRQIEFYEWEGENGLTLTLRLRQRFTFFRTLSLPIRVPHKDTAEDLMTRYLQKDKIST